MRTYQLLYALTCFVLITKSVKVSPPKVNPPSVNGEFKVYSKSSGAYGDRECVIRINGGDNLCENKRGHNVVVVNPISLEYESVSFDTSRDPEAPQRMVAYLSEVRTDMLIVMALKDSTRQGEGYWKEEHMSYIDSYGSETIYDHGVGRVIENDGCPFNVGYNAWTLVTQKRPLVPFISAMERILPDWVTCSYKENIQHSAVIDKVVNLTLPCDTDERTDLCSNDLAFSYFKNVNAHRNRYSCLKDDNCQIRSACLTGYTVAGNSEVNNCGWDGRFTNYKCPSCKSIFGLEKKDILEKVTIYEGHDSSIKFEFKPIGYIPHNLKFYIHYKEHKKWYRPNTHHLEELEEYLPNETYNVELTDTENLLIYINEGVYTVELHLTNPSVSEHDKNEFRLIVLVLDDNPATNYKPRHILHDYTKVISVK